MALKPGEKIALNTISRVGKRTFTGSGTVVPDPATFTITQTGILIPVGPAPSDGPSAPSGVAPGAAASTDQSDQ